MDADEKTRKNWRTDSMIEAYTEYAVGLAKEMLFNKSGGVNSLGLQNFDSGVLSEKKEQLQEIRSEIVVLPKMPS